MNQKNLLILGETNLKKFNIKDAYIKAKKLLEYVLNQNDSQLVMNSLKEVSENKKAEYEAKIQEIINGKPLQYITNSQEFMGLNFFVNENVLIPQPDTEILVETAIEIIKESITDLKCECLKKLKKKEIIEKSDAENTNANKPIQVLDLCTGSGCIGISIAKYIENTKVTATDISKEAIQVAKKNAILNNVEPKIEFIVSNLFENIGQRQFNYIVSNPPYIETSTIKTLSKEVQNEPNLALDGGEDGLKFYKEILKKASKYLLPNGYLIVEIGYNQAEKIITAYKKLNNIISKKSVLENYNECEKNESLILENYTEHKKNGSLILETTTPIKDLAGNDRVLVFKKILAH